MLIFFTEYLPSKHYCFSSVSDLLQLYSVKIYEVFILTSWIEFYLWDYTVFSLWLSWLLNIYEWVLLYFSLLFAIELLEFLSNWVFLQLFSFLLWESQGTLSAACLILHDLHRHSWILLCPKFHCHSNLRSVPLISCISTESNAFILLMFIISNSWNSHAVGAYSLYSFWQAPNCCT